MVCTVAAGVSAEYYLNDQVSYYVDGKEPVGKWFAPRSKFGLDDEAPVDAGNFLILHDGRDPSRLRYVVAPGDLRNRVAGYDMTFSAPKGVSILWAIADSDTRQKFEAAQEKAVREALHLIDKNAVFARRGRGGMELEETHLTAALFQHGEARPVGKDVADLKSDPQLHTHAVVMNIAERADGTLGAIDGRHLFLWKMAAGAVYRASLAAELQAQMGIKFSKTDAKGLFEIEGVPATLIEHFSKRRGEISRKLDELNLTSAENPLAAAKITKSSRSSKEAATESREEQFARWQKEAKDLGLTQESAAALYGRAVIAENKITDFDKRLRAALENLTESESTFQKRDLYVAVATAATGTGRTYVEIEKKVEVLLQEEWVVTLQPDRLGRPVFTTTHQLQLEQGLRARAKQMARKSSHAISAETVTKALNGSSLSNEQADAVRAAAQFADLAVIEGAAGSGKSYSLRTLASLYANAGYRVIGTATAWKTARALGKDCNIECRATDSWFAIDASNGKFLNNRTLLVVDEAGQLSARQMHRILESAARAGAKVILAGDQKQLQAIGAGPGLRLVAELTGVARIDTIRRQEHAWARKAATAFANGRAEQGLAAFRENNAIHLHESKEETLRAIVDAWELDRSLRPGASQLVMARANSEVETLSHMMRERLKETGKVSQQEVTVWNTNGKPLSLAKGDQIRFTRRIDEIEVVNGTTAEVASIQADARNVKSITLFVDGKSRTLAFSQFADAKDRLPLKYNYASTLYAAQGATVDYAYLVASPQLKRSELYVGASRARQATHLFVDREQAIRMELDSRMLSSRKGIDLGDAVIFARLGKAWSKARDKVSALDHLAAIDQSNRRTGESYLQL